jgi:hypothetical protein
MLPQKEELRLDVFSMDPCFQLDFHRKAFAGVMHRQKFQATIKYADHLSTAKVRNSE